MSTTQVERMERLGNYITAEAMALLDGVPTYVLLDEDVERVPRLAHFGCFAAAFSNTGYRPGADEAHEEYCLIFPLWMIERLAIDLMDQGLSREDATMSISGLVVHELHHYRQYAEGRIVMEHDGTHPMGIGKVTFDGEVYVGDILHPLNYVQWPWEQEAYRVQAEWTVANCNLIEGVTVERIYDEMIREAAADIEMRWGHLRAA